MRSVSLIIAALSLLAGAAAGAAEADWKTGTAELRALLLDKARPGDPETTASRIIKELTPERLTTPTVDALHEWRLAIAKVEFLGATAEIRDKASTLLTLVRAEEQRLITQSEEHLRDELLAILQQSLAATEPGPVKRLVEKLQPVARGGEQPKPASSRFSRLRSAATQLAEILPRLAEILTRETADQRRFQIQMLVSEGVDLTALLPRSELLDLVNRSYPLMEPDPKRRVLAGPALESRIREVVAQAVDLENLPRVVSEIRDLTRPDKQVGGGNFQNVASYAQIQQALSMYMKAYTDFKAGNPVRLFLMNSPVRTAPGQMPGTNDPRAGIVREELGDVETAVLRTVLPRALQLPKGTVLTPEETPLTFLPRALKEAAAREDWETVLRILKFSSRWDFWGAIKTVDDMGLHRFLLALQKKDEGKLEDAVSSYLFALQSGSSLLPAERIGNDLRALRQIDPARYEAGVSRAVNAIFVQSLIYRYQSYGFASFLTPIDERHDPPMMTQQAAMGTLVEAPAAP